MAVQQLSWTGPFQYRGMVKISAPGDGSCLFHSLSMAYNQVYRLQREGNTYVSRKSIVLRLRDELANLLAAPIDPLDPQSPRHYDILARGSLQQSSEVVKEYTLEEMQNTLRSKRFIDYMFFEFISDAIQKDIYVLDGMKQDVYNTMEEDLYQKGRPSIVLIFYSNHYELIGIRRDQGIISTLFTPDDTFIQTIKTRQDALRRK